MEINISKTAMNEKSATASYYVPNTSNELCQYDWVYLAYKAEEKKMLFSESLIRGDCLEGIETSLAFLELDKVKIKGALASEGINFFGDLVRK
jgi:hypothetical protein